MSGGFLVHLPAQSGVLADLNNSDGSWGLQVPLFLQWLPGNAYSVCYGVFSLS